VKFARPEHAPEAHFDITAMVDVVLLLIIFFSFTAQFSRSLATPMDLPAEKGLPPAPSGATHSVTIDLTREGAVRVMGRDVDQARLAQMLARDVRQAGGGDNLEVIIRADRGCRASHLNSLAGVLTAVGVKTWKLATAEEGA
jgi:biopolymer transport protein ExbD